MFVIPLLLAAGSAFPTLISGAPVTSLLSSLATRSTTPLQDRAAFTYTIYAGDGTVAEGWPDVSAWQSLDDMFTDNHSILNSSCTQFSGAGPNNSEDEITDLKNAVNSVANSTGVDPRFIFAIVMQESNGCVRAPTTNYGVRNPGLMQSHNGVGTCNDGRNIQNPCPASVIQQMIQDGTGGTLLDPYGGSGGGDGLVQLLSSTVTDVSRYYNAARRYNSGSLSPSGNLDTNAATPCYASDIANRLVGWSYGTSSCTSAKVASLDAAANAKAGAASGSVGTPETPVQAAPAPVVTNTVVPLPASTAAVAPAAASTHASTPNTPSVPITPSTSTAQIYPGAVSPCASYYTVVAGDYCNLVASKTGVSFATLRTLNSGLDPVCSNLWLGYRYCLQA